MRLQNSGPRCRVPAGDNRAGRLELGDRCMCAGPGISDRSGTSAADGRGLIPLQIRDLLARLAKQAAYLRDSWDKLQSGAVTYLRTNALSRILLYGSPRRNPEQVHSIQILMKTTPSDTATPIHEGHGRELAKPGRSLTERHRTVWAVVVESLGATATVLGALWLGALGFIGGDPPIVGRRFPGGLVAGCLWVGFLAVAAALAVSLFLVVSTLGHTGEASESSSVNAVQRPSKPADGCVVRADAKPGCRRSPLGGRLLDRRLVSDAR